MRVYLPATLPLLREWLDAASASPLGVAYGVTPALREWYREGDIDELEHSASLLAAAVSLDLLAADPAAASRRVVLAVDVDDAQVTPDQDERGALRLTEPIPLKRWGSALIDEADAPAAVQTAVAVLRDRSASVDDVEFAVGAAEDVDLGWHAVQELRYLLD
jgi:hypothetical protein